MWGQDTFVMGKYSSWNLELSARRKIAASRLEEEEGLLGNCIIKFLCVVSIVATYGHDLSCVLVKVLDLFAREQLSKRTFLPCLTKAAAAMTWMFLRITTECTRFRSASGESLPSEY